MAQELLLQTNCGASGDMILAALIDLLDAGDAFRQTFDNIGLAVTVTVEDIVKNHLRCKQVTVTAPAGRQAKTGRRSRQETSFSDLEAFIAYAPFSTGVKTNARRIFEAIFRAEADVHGEELKNVHLHEIGADDSLIDILGFCWLWEMLDCCPLFFTTLVTGRGDIQTRHGLLPVPPPAVLNLIRGLEYRSGDIESELLTPTAAAILTSCGRQADGGRTLKALKTGCGGGHKTFPNTPNILRAILSETVSLAAAPAPCGPAANDHVWVLEFSLDDSSGEMVAAAGEKIAQAGAMDIFIASGLMKKGRPGLQLTVLCADADREKVIATIFRESTVIGLRQRREERVILQRETQTIRVAGSEVRVKISSWENRVMNIKPEFADVSLLADSKLIPLKQAMLMVQGVINEKYGSVQD
ncbi:MAG: nickel pincer cofactor biosynthesis protein LarC [Candidatus Aminicenantes bacterium]|nr:nickel pincer cofactor biosynthesis protein LarC [Candidatus Aminicenantes bacterium]